MFPPRSPSGTAFLYHPLFTQNLPAIFDSKISLHQTFACYTEPCSSLPYLGPGLLLQTIQLLHATVSLFNLSKPKASSYWMHTKKKVRFNAIIGPGDLELYKSTNWFSFQ